MSEFSSPIGVLYISIEIEKVAEKFNNEFPSPIGVLYISGDNDEYRKACEIEFPSPIGVLYISIILRSPYNYWAAKPDCGAKPNPAFTI